MWVTKRSGQKEAVSFDKVLQRISKVAHSFNLDNVDCDRIAQTVIAHIYDGISTKELDEETARIAHHEMGHPDYHRLAAVIIVSNNHKNTPATFEEYMDKNHMLSDDFRVHAKAHLPRIQDTLDRSSTDYNLDYLGFKTLERSYLVRDSDGEEVIERPSYLYMRVAVGLHGTDIESVTRTFYYMSNGYFTHATPTLFNAGTMRPQLSSCFLLGTEDSLEGIHQTMGDAARISKWGGGLGVHISNIRAEGSLIKGTNGKSRGILPMLRTYNSYIGSWINQGGKRNGSVCFYLEPWHADIFTFVNLRRPQGDADLRTRDIFLGLWIPDRFMKAVKEDSEWYLMDPAQSPGLDNVYGKEFDHLYDKYIAEGRYVQKLGSVGELWRRILDSQMETGTPFLLYKDACNEKSNQKNLGTIRSSNLCVAPETHILTRYGYRRIEHLENTEQEVWNGREWSMTKILRTNHTEVRLIRIRFSNGAELRCTPYHLFYLEDGSGVEAKDLQIDDVLEPWDLPHPNSYYHPAGQVVAYVRAQLTHCTVSYFGGVVIVACSDSNRLHELFRALQQLGVSQMRRNDNGISIIQTDLADRGILSDMPDTSDTVSPQSQAAHEKVRVESIDKDAGADFTYCFTEPARGRGMFAGVVTGNCTEIIEYSNQSEGEIAVCTLASVALPKFVSDDGGSFNYNLLHEVVKEITYNLNRVIDLNYYPVEAARNSSMKHRPIGIGVQGLADVYAMMHYPYESQEARRVNRNIFKTIYFAALQGSMELAKRDGPYESWSTSPSAAGILQPELWGDEEAASGFSELRGLIQKYGLRNSLLTCCMPTSTTSAILGNNECTEPFSSNFYARKTLSGEFTVVNKHLVKDLMDLGLWSDAVYRQILANGGSVQSVEGIPERLRQIYKTVWEIKQKELVIQSKERGPYIDQSQSLNLWFAYPSHEMLTRVHLYTWEAGLKTGCYYIRGKPASDAQQITLNPSQAGIACTSKEDCVACSA